MPNGIRSIIRRNNERGHEEVCAYGSYLFVTSKNTEKLLKHKAVDLVDVPQ